MSDSLFSSAINAASEHIATTSAPENPSDLFTKSEILTLSATGLDLRLIFNICSLDFSSGGPTYIYNDDIATA